MYLAIKNLETMYKKGARWLQSKKPSMNDIFQSENATR